jgi:uncharacterized protein YukE
MFFAIKISITRTTFISFLAAPFTSTKGRKMVTAVSFGFTTNISPSALALLTTPIANSRNLDRLFSGQHNWSWNGGAFTNGNVSVTPLSASLTNSLGNISWTNGTGQSAVSWGLNLQGGVENLQVSQSTSTARPSLRESIQLAEKLVQGAKEFGEWLMEFITETLENRNRRKPNGATGGGSTGGSSASAGAGGANTLDPSEWAVGSDGEESWFVQMAMAMGEIIKNRALELKDLLEEIKAAGDNPPQALAMKFQGKTQEMQFIMNAFSTALNAIGETIKKALEQAR